MDRHDDPDQRLRELFSASRRVDREDAPDWHELRTRNPRPGTRPRLRRRAVVLTLATAATGVVLFAATGLLLWQPVGRDIAMAIPTTERDPVIVDERVASRIAAPAPTLPSDVSQVEPVGNEVQGRGSEDSRADVPAKLESLGYVAGSATVQEEAKHKPAPSPPSPPPPRRTPPPPRRTPPPPRRTPPAPVVVAGDVAEFEGSGDAPAQGQPVPGRYYQSVLTMPPGVGDAASNDAHDARSRDFRATVGGVSNVDPRTGSFTTHVRLTPEEQTTPADGFNTEGYAHVEEAGFVSSRDEPLSTFSIDVDTASYANVRRFLNSGSLPPKGAVRIEEMINYFSYDYPEPSGTDPFSITVEVADCPWNPANRLARIGLKGRETIRRDYPGSNLVFLVDVSGSMRAANKLGLLKSGLMLLAEQLDDRDSVAIVTYAGSSGVVLESTPGSDTATIQTAIALLSSGGGTNGAAGIRSAYSIARENFISGGVNRVILATDGDFNVGVTSSTELLDLIRDDADNGVFLTALGVGMGNYKDDTLEQLANRGNGNYFYLDSLREARKVLVEELAGTLVTIAKDVKIQVEFNPAEVGAYRLIGYDNRRLANQDFNDDSKDAGEIGAGHTVTALYELIPPGRADDVPGVDPLRYQQPVERSSAATSGELMTIKVRYKEPEGRTSRLLARSVYDEGRTMRSASDDLRFAAAVAEFGMVLRESDYRARADLSRVLEKGANLGQNESRREFFGLVGRALDAGARGLSE